MEPQADVLPENRYQIVSYKGQSLSPDLYNVVRAPFLTTLRNYNDWFKLIDKECYFNIYGKYIDALVSKENSVLRFAKLDDDTVLGWCLYGDDYVHYVWVKEEVRNQGIGMALLPNQFKYFSHMTRRGAPIWANKYPGKKFNPFI